MWASRGMCKWQYDKITLSSITIEDTLPYVTSYKAEERGLWHLFPSIYPKYLNRFKQKATTPFYCQQ